MVGNGKRKIEAVGRDKDSEVRQRAAIESYAKAAASGRPRSVAAYATGETAMT
jgi:hypothetical protein